MYAEKMYCKICEKWNHNTEQCWKNPINRSLESALEGGPKEAGNGEEDLDIMGWKVFFKMAVFSRSVWVR